MFSHLSLHEVDLEVGLEAYFHTRIFDRQLVAAAEVVLVDVTHQGVAAKEWALGWATVPLFDKVLRDTLITHRIAKRFPLGCFLRGKKRF